MHKRFERIDIATEHVVPLPPGWTGQELVGLVPRSRMRSAAASTTCSCSRRSRCRGGMVLVSIEVAETIARAAPAFFTALLASVDVK